MLKSEVALLQTLSHALIPSRSILQMLANFSAKFRKRKRKLLFTSCTKREIRHFHVVFVQWRQINVQKRGIHVQTAKVLLFQSKHFLTSRCRRRRICLSTKITRPRERLHHRPQECNLPLFCEHMWLLNSKIIQYSQILISGQIHFCRRPCHCA